MSVIEIKNLKKTYGKARGINDVTLSIEQGELFGFVGPNGAGKSTTIKILLNMIFPTSGKASICGLDVTTASKEIKKFTTYVPSDVRLYGELTVKEILKKTQLFYNIASWEETDRLCSYFEVEKQKKIRELSTGNKKKVALICALIPNPRVLILDEPANGLDPVMQRRLFAELKARTLLGATVMLSSHNLAEIEEYCARVALIKEGNIAAVEELSGHVSTQKLVTLWGGNKPQESENINIAQAFDHKCVFTYTGGAKELAGLLLALEPEDFTVEGQSLEDEFIRFYEGSDK